MSTSSAEEFAGIAVMVVYGVVAVLTLLVILRKARLIKLPRPFALVTWYAVIVIGSSWLLFFSVYMFLHHDGPSRLAALAYTCHSRRSTSVRLSCCLHIRRKRCRSSWHLPRCFDVDW